MIEMYGFIAAVTAQIIFFSVLGPLRVTRVLRQQRALPSGSPSASASSAW